MLKRLLLVALWRMGEFEKESFRASSNNFSPQTCEALLILNVVFLNFIICGGKYMQGKPEVISTVKIQYQPDLYKIVDTLNRNLKYDSLLFGLALDKEDNEQAIITIYRT